MSEMEIIVSIKSSFNTKLNVSTGKDEYTTIYTDDRTVISLPSEDTTSIKIYKDNPKKDNIGFFMLKLPFYIIRGFFDIILLNTPDNWVSRIEPYSFSFYYHLDLSQTNEISIFYKPSKYAEILNNLIPPEISVNGKKIDLCCDFVEDSIDISFQNYASHSIAICFYAVLIDLLGNLTKSTY